MNKLILIGLFLFVIIIQGCQKDEDLSTDNLERINQLEELQTSFAKTFAVALNENSELRTLVKKEALKQFDKDYDVLYYQLKNRKVGNETVSQLLSRLAESETEFKRIEDELPLLNIYVPQLPDFSAELWDTGSDIPKVAVDLSSDSQVVIFDFDGNKEKVEEGMIPAFPVVVVKTNERLVVEESNLKSGNPFPFRFLDESFNGALSSQSANNSTEILANKESLTKGAAVFYNSYYALAGQSYWEATHLGGDKLWQRDYAYYGMTLNKTEGELNNNVREYLNYIRFTSDAGLQKISDQSIDPKLINKKFSLNFASWTEGHFEFVVDIIINSKNGVGDVLQKRFPVKADELFHITYKRIGFYYIVDKIVPILATVNLKLTPWDLDSYGNAWKFIVSEYDPSQIEEYSKTSTTEHSGNFSLSGTLLKKIGWKLGGSSKKSTTTTVKITTTKDSDKLGEATLSFDERIIDWYEEGYLGVPAISTGYLELYVAPR